MLKTKLTHEQRYVKYTHSHTKFRKTWAWNDDENRLFKTLIKGFTLHVCCGSSDLGDVKVDLFERADIVADLTSLPFRKYSFDTVLCDPPWKMYNRFRWILDLKDLAKERLILVTPNIAPHLRGMEESFIIARRNLINFKVIVIYDRLNKDILSYT